MPAVEQAGRIAWARGAVDRCSSVVALNVCTLNEIKEYVDQERSSRHNLIRGRVQTFAFIGR